MEAFKNFIVNYTKLTESDWQIIQNSFERIEVSKNEVFVEEGKVCRYFYFLEKGLIRFFSLIDGNDITKMFTIAPGCFTSKSSFRQQKASQESIQALEKSILWRVSFNQLKGLSTLDSWNTFIRNFIYEVEEFTEDFLMEIRTETAEERYQKLMERYPKVIHKIPLKHLSSFLGIAPQSLSRIRKKLHKNRKS